MKKYLFLILSITYIASASQLFDRCAVCHGDKGEKHSKGLTKSIAGMKADDVVKILREYKAAKRNTYGLGKMMQGQAGRLSEDDIKEVAIYIESLPPHAEPIVDKADTNKKITAQDIFKKCAICHGEKGQKKSLGVSKKIAGMNAKDIVKILKEYKAGTRNTYNYGLMMKGQATKISEEQMNSVAIYIESLAPVKSDDEKQKEVKKITKEEVEYNKFLEEYFKNSKNPNETFEEAKKRYEDHKQTIKDKNE
ncbi:c-type cytochrome [Sulfurimonas sp. CS5]|uniref:c-type cytochrome n=1 Tax=Sulfurimonas sp. CS5 TaxID=3391145 RepID=UPI0039E94269